MLYCFYHDSTWYIQSVTGHLHSICTVMYYTVLYFTVLYCTVMYSKILYSKLYRLYLKPELHLISSHCISN